MTRLCPCGQMPDELCACEPSTNPLVVDASFMEPYEDVDSPGVKFAVLEPTVGEPKQVESET